MTRDGARYHGAMKPWALAAMALAGCVSSRPWGAAIEVPATSGSRTFPIAITKHGFEPRSLTAQVGDTVDLVFTREVEKTCVTRVIVSLDETRTLERELPLGKPVHVILRFDRPGNLGFHCPMDMYGGSIDVAGASSNP